MSALAACDQHLSHLLGQMVPENSAVPALIRSVDKPDDHYRCSCGVHAHWFITRLTSRTQASNVIDRIFGATR